MSPMETVIGLLVRRRERNGAGDQWERLLQTHTALACLEERCRSQLLCATLAHFPTMFALFIPFTKTF